MGIRYDTLGMTQEDDQKVTDEYKSMAMGERDALREMSGTKAGELKVEEGQLQDVIAEAVNSTFDEARLLSCHAELIQLWQASNNRLEEIGSTTVRLEEEYRTVLKQVVDVRMRLYEHLLYPENAQGGS